MSHLLISLGAQTWPVCGASAVDRAWAFVKVGIPCMFAQWIKGLMGYGAKSFVRVQRSVKHKNIPELGVCTNPWPTMSPGCERR